MLSRNKPYFRLISLILALCLYFNFLAIPVYAAPGEAQRNRLERQKSDITPQINELPDKLPKQKLELVSKRTKFSSRYLNPDGSFTEQIFLQPQFYLDSSDKQWKKIDNNLKASVKKPDGYENTAGDFKVWFAKQSGSDVLVSLEKNGNSITLLPVQSQSTKASVKNNEITYKELYPDTDLRYRLQGGSLKEELVLQNQTKQNIYTFEMNLNGLTAKVEADGTISLLDNNGNQIWYFVKPYMTDANETFSDKVSLKLREADGKTLIDLIVDPAFLNDPATKFPVTIDPTISVWEVTDTYISSGFPNSSFPTSQNLHVGNDNHPFYGNCKSLVRFFLPSLPSDSVLSNATFYIYGSQSFYPIDLLRITEAWGDNVTWNTIPQYSGRISTLSSPSAGYYYYTGDITEVVKNWYKGTYPNYGLLLALHENRAVLWSSEAGSNTPYLSINYTINPTGLEKQWTFTKDGVNPVNGNMVFQKSDLSIPGRGIPVTVSRTYNSNQSANPGLFGYGWTSNIETRLIDAGSGPITLIDEDGTRHIFGQNSQGEYVAAGGVYLTLIKNQDGTYTIYKIDGTKINFNADKKLSSIIDTNGNATVLNYDTAGKLTSIKDVSMRTTAIAYGSNGYVSGITDPANRTVNYEYDTAGNLTKVTDTAGKFKTHAYNQNHYLTSVTDERNITSSIEYDASNRVSKVNRPVTIDGVPTTSATNYVYDTANSKTQVTDGENRRVDYKYDSAARVVEITKNPLDAQNKAVSIFTYDTKNNLIQMKDANNNSYNYTYDDTGNLKTAQLPDGKIKEYNYDSRNNLINSKDFNGNLSLFDYDPENNQIETTDANRNTSAKRYNEVGNLENFTHPLSAAENYVINSSFEVDASGDSWPDNWTQGKQPDTTANFAWQGTNKYGSKSVGISNPTGWAVISSDLIPFTAGEKYIASGYVKTSGATGTTLIKLEYFDAGGTWLDQKVSYNLAGTHDWTRIQTVIDNAPANTDKIRVSVGMNPGTGTAYFDCIQVEKGTMLSSYNQLENGSMEVDPNGDRFPEQWTGGSLGANDTIDQNVNPDDDKSYIGANSFKITGETGKNKYLKQRLNVSGDSTTPLTLSGWSRQVDANVNGGEYSLKTGVNYTDGTTGWFANDFNKQAADWQHVAASIKPSKPFNSIDVYLCYYNQAGTAWFDAIRLNYGAVHTKNSYDGNQNYLTRVEDPLGNTVNTIYDAAGNTTSIKDAKNQTTSHIYEPRDLLTQVTDTKLGVTSYDYDAAGNLIKFTDPRSKATSYDYNELNLVSKVTNPLNQAIQFGYNKNGDIAKVQFPSGNLVSYNYNALNRADSVFYNGVKKWDIGYDANGNTTAVTNVTSGQTTGYTYDVNNRLTRKTEGPANSFDYGYDDNGNVTSLKVTAGAVAVTAGYDYNPLDQVTGLSRNGVNQAKYIYDERGNLISIRYANGTGAYTAF